MLKWLKNKLCKNELAHIKSLKEHIVILEGIIDRKHKDIKNFIQEYENIGNGK